MSTSRANNNETVSVIKRTLFDGIVLGYLIIVAIIAVAQPGKETMLNLGPNAALAFSCFLIGAFASFLTNRSGIRTLGEYIFEPPHKKEKEATKAWYKTFWGIELIVTFVVTFYLGIVQTNFSIAELLDPYGIEGAARLFGGLISPNFAILPKAVLAVIETIFIAFMATTIAIPVAFILSFLCAKNIMNANHFVFGVYGVLRTILNVTRSVEPLIWAIIFSIWVGIGPFAGMLALMIHSVASLAKQYSEIVECVDEGPIEAIQATGAGPLQVIWFAVVPQIVLPYISFTIYRWDINVRMATIIGLVGGGGIGTLLIQYQGQAQWHEVGCIILVIAIVVWLMDTASAYLREAIK